MELFELVRQAHRSSESAMLNLLRQFDPLLKKYARLLHREDAYEDLQCEFIAMIKKTDWEERHILNQGALINYFSATIRHKYIALSKSDRSDKEYNISSFSENREFMIHCSLSAEDAYNTLLMQDLKTVLTSREFQVIKWTCLKDYSVAVLAMLWGVSKQNINQIRKRALKKLRMYYKSVL